MTCAEAPRRASPFLLMTRERTEKLFSSSALLVLQAAAAAVFTMVLMHVVVKTGHDIPQPDLSADYLVALVWAVALAAALWLAPFPAHDRADLLLLWSARVVVALVLMLFYEGYYGGMDAYYYFKFAGGSIHLFRETKGSGTNFMLHLTQLHGAFMPASFHAIKLSFAMAGLAGVYIFYRAAVMFLGYEDRRI